MTTSQIVLAIVGLVLGVVVLIVVAALLGRVHRPLREAEDYAREIEGVGGRIAANVEVAGELTRTRELATAVAAQVRGER